MSSRMLLFAQAVCLSLLVLLDVYYGIDRSYYYHYPWFDIVTHIVGGIAVGFFAGWIGTMRRNVPTLLFILAVALMVGGMWEVFEAYVGITHFPADTLDTIKDLCDDLIGGASAFYLARAFRWI